jgi:hypothetical protein
MTAARPEKDLQEATATRVRINTSGWWIHKRRTDGRTDGEWTDGRTDLVVSGMNSRGQMRFGSSSAEGLSVCQFVGVKSSFGCELMYIHMVDATKCPIVTTVDVSRANPVEKSVR